MSSIVARTYLTPEEYIDAKRKANNGYLANSVHLRIDCRSLQLGRNSPYTRFTDSLNLKPMIPLKLPVVSKRGNLSYANR